MNGVIVPQSERRVRVTSQRALIFRRFNCTRDNEINICLTFITYYTLPNQIVFQA